MQTSSVALHDPPLPDLATPELPCDEQLAAVAAAGYDFVINIASHKGHRVWVHCAASMRVTTFLGLCRMLREGWPEDSASALMHGAWKPNSAWKSFIAARLANAGFISPFTDISWQR